MELGLKRDEVRLVAYTEEWKKEFQRVKQAIVHATSISKNRIEHIGSTAIIGMDAIPILDIVVGVDDIEKRDVSL